MTKLKYRSHFNTAHQGVGWFITYYERHNPDKEAFVVYNTESGLTTSYWMVPS